jgi:hypothetical protein
MMSTTIQTTLDGPDEDYYTGRPVSSERATIPGTITVDFYGTHAFNVEFIEQSYEETIARIKEQSLIDTIAHLHAWSSLKAHVMVSHNGEVVKVIKTA